MNKNVLVAFLLLFTALAHGQIRITPENIHFGIVGPSTDRVADIVVRNTGDKKALFLRHTFGFEYEVMATAKEVLPDSTLVIRIKFKPREKRIYNDTVEIYFSSMDEPVILHIDANVQFLSPADDTPCPDFSHRVAECCESNMFLAEVVDATNHLPINQATVTVTEQGKQQLRVRTGKEGKVSQFIPIGYYTIEARAEGYTSKSVDSYVNKHNHYFLFELQYNQEETSIVPPADVIATDTLLIQAEPVPDLVQSEWLPEDQFRPNNIVFLVDVSNSMSENEKMELMKSSLENLGMALRAMDQMAIVSYSTEAALLLPSTAGDKKEQISAIIRDLEASGRTSASKGLSKALTEVNQNHLEGGNNQVIIITDGAFEVEDQELVQKLVKRMVRKHIVLSIAGIRASAFAARKLEEYTTQTGGAYIAVENDEDARAVLLEEIRKRSAR